MNFIIEYVDGETEQVIATSETNAKSFAQKKAIFRVYLADFSNLNP